jgi:hypothetical protein
VEPREVVFTDTVMRRVERIPITFIREKVRKGLLAYAARHDLRVLTSDDMDRALAGSRREGFGAMAGASLFGGSKGDAPFEGGTPAAAAPRGAS